MTITLQINLGLQSCAVTDSCSLNRFGERYPWEAKIPLNSVSSRFGMLKNDLLWVQFNDEAINVTDALPRRQSDSPATLPFLATAARSEGVYSTFTFETPIAVDFIAATLCSYLRTRFPGSLDAVTWTSEEFTSRRCK